MKNARLLKFIFCFLTVAFGLSTAHAQSKPQLISTLQAWRASIQQDQNLEDFEKDLRTLFVNRLVFQTEKNYPGDGGAAGLRSFMIQTLKSLEKVDRMASNLSFASDAFFVSNLLISIQENLEPTEDILAFMHAFIDYSGVSDPASAEEFGAHRSYINGDQLVVVNPIEAEEASSSVADMIEAEAREEKLPVRLLEQDFKPYQFFPAQELIPSDLMLENSLMPYSLSSRP